MSQCVVCHSCGCGGMGALQHRLQGTVRTAHLHTLQVQRNCGSMAGRLPAVAATDASTWDKRYADKDQFAYGQEPNVFIRACAQKYLKDGPVSIVELASGEGRNVVYLAQQGHSVTGVDFSKNGLEKTVALAQSRGCADKVTTQYADVFAWEPQQPFDAVVMSFCHVPSPEKPAFFNKLATKFLKPGGLLLLECFHPDQIAKGYRAKSGGPGDPNMMFTVEELRRLLQEHAGQELESAQVEYELKEGPLHDGIGALTRYVWRKAQA